MKYLKILLFGVLLTTLISSCNYRYTITKTYIKSKDRKFTNGFAFHEIVVGSVDSTGYPVKYISFNRIKLGTADLAYGKKLGRKIYFYKEYEGFHWYNSDKKTIYPVLPIKMKPNHWYYISGLASWGYAINIFIHVDKEGKLQTFYNSKPEGLHPPLAPLARPLEKGNKK